MKTFILFRKRLAKPIYILHNLLLHRLLFEGNGFHPYDPFRCRKSIYMAWVFVDEMFGINVGMDPRRDGYEGGFVEERKIERKTE